MSDTLQTAPDVTLPRDGGDMVSLTDLRPAPVVLFFYPRDLTPGCTKEAIAFSALLPEFEQLGCHVFGISADNLVSHDKFVAKHNLKIGLLSDTSAEVAQSFGVWKEKNMYGKKFMGIERSTFLINGGGEIARTWRKVKVDGHAEAVLDAVRAL